MAVRQFNRGARSKRAGGSRSVTSLCGVRQRVRAPNTQLLHIPPTAGQPRPIEGREAAMTLLQAVHVVAHAVLRGAFSIQWTAQASAPEHSRRSQQPHSKQADDPGVRE